MQKKLLLALAILMTSLQTEAQTIAADYKGTSYGNPISACVFCADPTALEYNGRLYVYGSNDHQQFIKNGKKGENTYGEIKSIVVFSTDDMVNWTFHGTIDTKKLCSSWVTNPWYQGYGVSWAPSVTWRTTEDGTEEFFLYFCNSSHGVGVLKANSPVGPWSSPLNKLLIHYDTPGANAAGTNANFDPGVTIDENGVGWLSFGGLGPSTIMPDAARIVKLKPSMTEVDGAAVKIHAPYHFEANELNVMNGKYVYTYCSNWANRSDADWNAYKQAHGISASKPNTCTMCYMVSDNPMDPDSWVYKGVYGPHPGMGTNNNHSHLQKFGNDYYYLYHGASLMEKWRSAGIIDQNCGIFRSICVNKATVNETTQKISEVTPNLTGCAAIKNLNPYDLQQAETMVTAGGIAYENFKNVKTVTSINTLGNDASANLYIKMPAGSWTSVRKVDFGVGARSFMVRAKGTGKLEIRLGRLGATASATVNLSSSSFNDYTIDVDETKFKGVKTVYFVFTESTNNNVQFDAWQFSEDLPTGIFEIHNSKSVPAVKGTYDLGGRRMQKTSSQHGLVIKNGRKVRQ
ncbi:MAG: family 43 glycosylhydrolase [Prevotella sp.]|nr:family 43 glycosylhydrolase [Prevotella sp.]